MYSENEYDLQRRTLPKLQSKLSAQLVDTLPYNADERIALLQTYLREGIEERGDDFSITFSLTPQNLPQHITLLTVLHAEAKRLRQENAVSLSRFSGCDAAVAEGIVLISAGCGIHPVAGVIGFMIGVELLLESC